MSSKIYEYQCHYIETIFIARIKIDLNMSYVLSLYTSELSLFDRIRGF